MGKPTHVHLVISRREKNANGMPYFEHYILCEKMTRGLQWERWYPGSRPRYAHVFESKSAAQKFVNTCRRDRPVILTMKGVYTVPVEL
jgi:hypothetical protein